MAVLSHRSTTRVGTQTAATIVATELVAGDPRQLSRTPVTEPAAAEARQTAQDRRKQIGCVVPWYARPTTPAIDERIVEVDQTLPCYGALGADLLQQRRGIEVDLEELSLWLVLFKR